MGERRSHLATPHEYLAEMLRLGSGFPRADDADREAKKWVPADRLPLYEAAVDALESVIALLDNESISFEDESMQRSFLVVRGARAALARLRDELSPSPLSETDR